MSEITYTSWGLIPFDDDVLSTEPTAIRPPMIGNLALDKGASLVFELSNSTNPLTVRLITTAFSAAEANKPFQLLKGAPDNRFEPLDIGEWKLQYDGQFAHFTTTVEAANRRIKLHCCAASSIVLTSVHFS